MPSVRKVGMPLSHCACVSCNAASDAVMSARLSLQWHILPATDYAAESGDKVRADEVRGDVNW